MGFSDAFEMDPDQSYSSVRCQGCTTDW